MPVAEHPGLPDKSISKISVKPEGIACSVRLKARAQVLFNCLLSKAKNPPELSRCQRMDDLPSRPERQAIGNLIPNRRYPAFFMETVAMNPLPVRTLNLLIHKPAGRVPQGNPCFPREGNAEQPQPVIDPGSFCHLNGLGGCNVEVKLRRRDAFKIGGVAKKSENRLDIKGKTHDCPQDMRSSVGFSHIDTEIKTSFHKSAPLPS